MPRLAPLLLLAALATGCGGLSPEEEELIEELRLRASQYYEADDLGRAEQQARRGLQLDPEHAELNHILGRTLLKWQDGRHVSAGLLYLQKAYELDPQYRTAYSLGECHLRLGELRIKRAVTLDLSAEELPPDDAEGRAEMADRAAKLRENAQEDLLEAERLLRVALESNPDNIFSLRLLAMAYSDLQRPEDALATIEQLIAVLVESRQWKNQRLSMEALPLVEEQNLRARLKEDLEMEMEARGLAAALHKAAKRYRESAAQLTEILKLDPGREQEYFNRGMCRYWLGDLASAHADMREFLRRTRLEFGAEQVERALDIVSEYEARTKGGQG
jgi:tetratricopeptide (TPR) repeat protein